MKSLVVLGEKEWLACCGSLKFAQEMVSAGPFSNYQEALNVAKDIWFNKVDVNGWLEAFAAHPQIGERSSSAQWSKGEQSTALATASDSTLEELYDWNTRYKQKFGFVFLIFASGISTPETLAEMKRRYENRPIVEFELAAKEQMKITELRISKLFSTNATSASTTKIQNAADNVTKAGEDRVSIIVGYFTTTNESSTANSYHTRTSPPITTHILDVASLEMSDNNQSRPSFGEADSTSWKHMNSSITDKDGRSGHLMKMVEDLNPGVYQVIFNTGDYNPEGFFPLVYDCMRLGSRQNGNIFMFMYNFAAFSLFIQQLLRKLVQFVIDR
ncbi:hypothetical protein ACJIZ3_016472 [Penstemon smallii]|uniref:2-oxo-4-hydroxy-4-carboxy-5-ureidoimidazoline decarboxylase n=1 Tax=Penstemon smallii TaxID=265156 RepID=A0ABD3RRA7_9LAMI